MKKQSLVLCLFIFIGLFFALFSFNLTSNFISVARAEQIDIIPNESDLPNLPKVGSSAEISPSDIVAKIFQVTITVAAPIFLLLLLFGGFTYLTSAGNEEGTGKAKKIMTNAIIGLVIIVAAYGLGKFILNMLGYNV